MRVAVLQLALSEQRARLFQRGDDRLVGPARLAVRRQHALAGEVGHMRPVHAVAVEIVGDLQPVGGAEIEVVGAVAGRDVHHARALVHGDEIGGHHRRLRAVAEGGERVRGDGAHKLRPLEARQHLVALEPAFREEGLEPRLGDDQRLAAAGHGDARIIRPGSDREAAIAGNGPGRRRPDDERGRPFQPAQHRHGDMDPGRDMVVIFDLGVGKRGLFGDRPEDRLHAPIEASVHDIAADFARNRRLGPVRHGGVVIVPVAEHAQALELLALGVDPERGELPAFPAELQDRHRVLVPAVGAVVLLDLPFDRQAVAVPAGDVVASWPVICRLRLMTSFRILLSAWPICRWPFA